MTPKRKATSKEYSFKTCFECFRPFQLEIVHIVQGFPCGVSADALVPDLPKTAPARRGRFGHGGRQAGTARYSYSQYSPGPGFR